MLPWHYCAPRGGWLDRECLFSLADGVKEAVLDFKVRTNINGRAGAQELRMRAYCCLAVSGQFLFIACVLQRVADRRYEFLYALCW